MSAAGRLQQSARLTGFHLRLRKIGRNQMRSHSICCASVIVGALGCMSGLAADLTPQPVDRVDVTALADGYRASKIVGATVANDSNQNIGKIDDLLVGRNDQVLYAIISVGSFLGVGGKLVAVPYRSLKIATDKLVLPGASRDALKGLPEFKYARG